MDKVHKRRLELFYHPETQVQGHDSALGILAERKTGNFIECKNDSRRDGVKKEFDTKCGGSASWPALVDVLWKHFLFSGTSKDQIKRVTSSMCCICPGKGEVVVREGELGSMLYVVESGVLHVTCSSEGSESVDILGPNRVFGELAMLFDCPRAATVTVASSESKLWCLSRDVLLQLESNFMSENLEKRVQQLKRIPEFEKFNHEKIRRIAAVMQEEVFDAGTVICEEGEKLKPGVNDKFYTIGRGQVSVSASRGNKPGSDDEELVSQDEVSVEKLDLMMDEMCTTEKPSSSIEIAQIIGNSGRSSSEQVETGVENDIGPRQEPVQHHLATLCDGQWFGEMALLNDNPRSATVRAVSRTYCYTLSRSAFVQIVSKSRGVIRRIASTSELRMEDNHETMFRWERSDIAARLTGLDTLQVLHVIGEGAFSVVRIATLRNPLADESDLQKGVNISFALKTMNKQDLLTRNQVLHVNDERMILEQTSHPFILSMIKTFQSKSHIYMLFELVQGGELFSRVINSNGGLPKEDVRFYAACVTEGLAYLHRKRIAYRDLKLENLVVSSDGYLKIIDFGFAKQLEHGQTTRTVCGTPDYLAPEAVTRQGHSWAVDCWSLGVVIFELLTQYSPYADTSGNNDHMAVFKRIMQGASSVNWNQLKTVLSNDEEFGIIQQLLFRLWDQNPRSRLTCAELKLPHPYFESISFMRLREKQIIPPWVPHIDGHLDTSHFDVEAFQHVKESTRPYQGNQDFFRSF